MNQKLKQHNMELEKKYMELKTKFDQLENNTLSMNLPNMLME